MVLGNSLDPPKVKWNIRKWTLTRAEVYHVPEGRFLSTLECKVWKRSIRHVVVVVVAFCEGGGSSIQ